MVMPAAILGASCAAVWSVPPRRQDVGFHRFHAVSTAPRTRVPAGGGATIPVFDSPSIVSAHPFARRDRHVSDTRLHPPVQADGPLEGVRVTDGRDAAPQPHGPRHQRHRLLERAHVLRMLV